MDSDLNSEDEITESESDFDILCATETKKRKKKRKKRLSDSDWTDEEEATLFVSQPHGYNLRNLDRKYNVGPSTQNITGSARKRKRRSSNTSTSTRNTRTNSTRSRRKANGLKPKRHSVKKEDKTSKDSEDEIVIKPKKRKNRKRKREKQEIMAKEPAFKKVKKMKMALGKQEIERVFKENGCEVYLERVLKDGILGIALWENLMARHWRKIIPKIGPRRRMQRKIREMIDVYNKEHIKCLDEIYGFEDNKAQNIEGFLEEMGLQKYTNVFKQNEIDICDLRYLEPSDLIKLIESQSDRERMKKMIALMVND